MENKIISPTHAEISEPLAPLLTTLRIKIFFAVMTNVTNACNNRKSHTFLSQNTIIHKLEFKGFDDMKTHVIEKYRRPRARWC